MYISLKTKESWSAGYRKWKNNLYPKFNTPQMKSELVNFAKQIAPECAMPEVGFNVDGIIKHVQCFFNEQRRYRNRKPALEVLLHDNLIDKFILPLLFLTNVI